MRIAIGYRHFESALGYHLERALRQAGHQVDYAGLPAPGRPGYDGGVPLPRLLERLQPGADLYLWIDPAGRYFPPGIEDAPIPTACYLVDTHLGRWRRQVARFFDAVFVAQKDHVPPYRQAAGHDQARWLPLAAAADVHRDWGLERVFDVGFVGNIAAAHRKTARARRLKLMAERFATNDFQRAYSPEETGRVYSQSRLAVNTSIAGDVTMRVFEASACGALVLTDAVANGLADLFDIGREVVTYADDADLLAKADYYLRHEDERRAIAEAGQRRTLACHTYVHRARAIVEAVSGPGFRQLAPMRSAGARERREARREVYTHLHMLDAILDEAQAAGRNPLRRAWAVLPCLARRLKP
jgi:hypothetical protein